VSAEGKKNRPWFRYLGIGMLSLVLVVTGVSLTVPRLWLEVMAWGGNQDAARWLVHHARNMDEMVYWLHYIDEPDILRMAPAMQEIMHDLRRAQGREG
jgi:hypothetical protein